MDFDDIGTSKSQATVDPQQYPQHQHIVHRISLYLAFEKKEDDPASLKAQITNIVSLIDSDARVEQANENDAVVVIKDFDRDLELDLKFACNHLPVQIMSQAEFDLQVQEAKKIEEEQIKHDREEYVDVVLPSSLTISPVTTPPNEAKTQDPVVEQILSEVENEAKQLEQQKQIEEEQQKLLQQQILQQQQQEQQEIEKQQELKQKQHQEELKHQQELKEREELRLQKELKYQQEIKQLQQLREEQKLKEQQELQQQLIQQEFRKQQYQEPILQTNDINIVVDSSDREVYLVSRVQHLRNELRNVRLPPRSKQSYQDVFSLVVKQKVLTGISVIFTGAVLLSQVVSAF